jgi:hypothetical protein
LFLLIIDFSKNLLLKRNQRKLTLRIKIATTLNLTLTLCIQLLVERASTDHILTFFIKNINYKDIKLSCFFLRMLLGFFTPVHTGVKNL